MANCGKQNLEMRESSGKQKLSKSSDRGAKCAVPPEETWYWDRWLGLNRSGKKDSADEGLHKWAVFSCELEKSLANALLFVSRCLCCAVRRVQQVCDVAQTKPSPAQWDLGRGRRKRACSEPLSGLVRASFQVSALATSPARTSLRVSLPFNRFGFPSSNSFVELPSQRTRKE